MGAPGPPNRAREDRHSDRGYDDELDAYNAMLSELTRNRR